MDPEYSAHAKPRSMYTLLLWLVSKAQKTATRRLTDSFIETLTVPLHSAHHDSVSKVHVNTGVFGVCVSDRNLQGLLMKNILLLSVL